MKTQNLIVCPYCEKLYHGIKGVNILGRIEPDGGFLILRFHSYKTIIYGENFSVVCGNCHETIYIHTGRRENGTIFNHGIIGLYSGTLSGTLASHWTSNNGTA